VSAEPVKASDMVIEPVSGTELDARHAVRLRGEAARGVRDSLQRATREGVLLARRATADPVYRLVAPEKLKSGLASKTLRHATPKSGDASVLVKNAKTGRIAGKADLKRVKPSLVGPALWQAMAVATQQHYLVEISGKLDGISRGVEEILARMDDQIRGKLDAFEEVADDAREHIARHGDLPDERIAELRITAKDAKTLWSEVKQTADRHLMQYKAGELDAEQVDQSFVHLVRATQVLMRCSEALLSVPHRTSKELEDAFAWERDRMMPALPDFEQSVRELVSASRTWGARHRKYEWERPKDPLRKGLNALPVVQIGPRKPEREAVPVETYVQFTRISEEAVPEGAVLARVLADGSVLIAPELPESVT
jgi:hypothetical protein